MLSIKYLNFKLLWFWIMYKKYVYGLNSKYYSIDIKFDINIKNIKTCDPIVRFSKYVVMLICFSGSCIVLHIIKPNLSYIQL